MGLRGPKPVPAEILAARGSQYAGRNTSPPRPGPGAPVRPAWLSTEAAKIWKGVCAVVAPGVLTRDCGPVLGRYCDMLLKWQRVSRKRGPMPEAYFKLASALLAIEREFGLTPSARTRVIVEPGARVQGFKGSRAGFFPKGPALRIAE